MLRKTGENNYQEVPLDDIVHLSENNTVSQEDWEEHQRQQLRSDDVNNTNLSTI